MNFRIDSKDWVSKRAGRNGRAVLESPQGDVWEIVKGPAAGEQLFTYSALVRLGLIGLLPTVEQWAKEAAKNSPSFRTAMAPYSGQRSHSSSEFYSAGKIGYYWLEPLRGGKAFYGTVSMDKAYPPMAVYKNPAFSVRLRDEV